MATSLLPAFARAQVTVPAQKPSPSVAKNTLKPGFVSALDAEMQRYMAAMNAPGMQLALTDLHGAEYVASYGFNNLETKQALTPDKLFQVGSISKSMGVLCVLQLVEEGRLDLHRPMLEYLPWLPWEMPFGPVTLHHVLTHSTGMADDGALFFPGDRWKHRQRYAPGTHYFYSNMAFSTLAYLVSKMDGRSYAESLRERVFKPVGMASAVGHLGGGEWLLQATSYTAAEPDKHYGRFDPLREAPMFHSESSAGCVAATPADMAAYIRCLLRGGVADSGKRVISAKSYDAMTTRYIEATEWGKGWGYGYGIAVLEADGDHVLLHTGGMVSFMSSMYLNRTKGVAAFASINAQQGYRPTPAVQWATRSFAASQAKLAAPAPIPIEPEKPAAAQPAPPTASTLPEAQRAFPGTYVNDDPWAGMATVTEQDGKLLLDGAALTHLADGSFWIESEPNAPDRCAFYCVAEGRAQVLTINGTEYRRIAL